jgi:very-short-patch-repair endonuclease
LGEGKLIQEKAMNLTNQARPLRKNQTDVERLVWKRLRNRLIYRYQLRRQFPIEPYSANFACLKLKLIIELDGGQHVNRINYDHQRSLFLEQRGFKTIRFRNNDVIENTEGVLEAMRLTVLKLRRELSDFSISPHPTQCFQAVLPGTLRTLSATKSAPDGFVPSEHRYLHKNRSCPLSCWRGLGRGEFNWFYLPHPGLLPHGRRSRHLIDDRLNDEETPKLY